MSRCKLIQHQTYCNKLGFDIRTTEQKAADGLRRLFIMATSWSCFLVLKASSLLSAQQPKPVMLSSWQLPLVFSLRNSKRGLSLLFVQSLVDCWTLKRMHIIRLEVSENRIKLKQTS